MERARLRMLKDVQCQVAMRWSKWSSGIKMQGHYERVHQPLQTPVTRHKPHHLRHRSATDLSINLPSPALSPFLEQSDIDGDGAIADPT